MARAGRASAVALDGGGEKRPAFFSILEQPTRSKVATRIGTGAERYDPAFIG
jgi:hypothetical protein